MAKVRMKTTSASPRGVSFAGDVLDVDDETAIKLVDGGYAVLLSDRSAKKPKVERATLADHSEKADGSSTRN